MATENGITKIGDGYFWRETQKQSEYVNGLNSVKFGLNSEKEYWIKFRDNGLNSVGHIIVWIKFRIVQNGKSANCAECRAL